MKKEYKLCKLYIRVLGILLFLFSAQQKIHATPIIHDTVTDLVVVFSNGTEEYYNLADNPLIVFINDSVQISVGTSRSVYHYKEITKYYHQVRIAASHIDSTICESNLPFVWNGLTFTTSGTQVLTLSSSLNRDSLVFLTVNVIETTYRQTIDTVIENSLPYSFLGNSYNISDLNALSPQFSYLSDTITLTNSYGCDSVNYLFLYVLNNITSYLFDSICQNELPITWNDITFTQAGTESVTLTCSNGADSTLVMTLVTLPSSTENMDIAIPENQLPFIIADRIYNNSTLDTITLTNHLGCDSVIYLNLIVYNNQTVVLDSTICESSLPITWNDSVFLSAGIKQIVLHNSNGADSIIVMHLSVIPTVYTTLQETILENQLPYSTHGKTYSVNDFSSYSLSDTILLMSQVGCDSVLYYTLSYLPNIYIDIDSTVCESTLPIVWYGLTFSSATTQQLTLQASSGVDSTLNLTLHVIATTYGHFSDTVPENELPYYFMDRQYSQAIVNDTFLLISNAGCDSLLLFTLVVFADSSTEGVSIPRDNPVVSIHGNILVLSSNSHGGTAFLYSVDGRLISQYKAIPNTTLHLRLDNYPAGVYFIRFNNTTYKFVKI